MIFFTKIQGIIKLAQLKYIFKSASSMALVKFLTAPLYILQTVILVRYWGLSARGEVAILTSVTHIIYVLFSLGFANAVLYYVKKQKVDVLGLLKIFFFHCCIVMAIVFIIFQIPSIEKIIMSSIENVKNSSGILYLCLLGFISILAGATLENSLIGSKNIGFLLKIKFIRAFLSCLTYYIIISIFPVDATKLIIFIFTVDFAVSIFSAMIFLFNNKLRHLEYLNFRNFYKFGIKSATHPIYPMTTNYAVVFISSMFIDTYSIGLWSIANSFSSNLVSSIKPLSSITFSETIGKKQDVVKATLFSTVFILIFGFAILSLLLFYLIEPFLVFAYGPEASSAAILVKFLLPILLVQVLVGQFSAVILAMNFGVHLSIILIVASLSFIIVLMKFVILYDLWGIIYALGTIRAFVLISIILLALYVIRLKNFESNG
jgi:O-antigen/teichoic acid export membrane protein